MRLCPQMYIGPVECEVEEPRRIHVLEDAVLVQHVTTALWVLPDHVHRTVRMHHASRSSISRVAQFTNEQTSCTYVIKQDDTVKIAQYNEKMFQSAMLSEYIVSKLPTEGTPKQIYSHERDIFISFFKEGEKVKYSLIMYCIDDEGELNESCKISNFNDNEVILSMSVVRFSRKITPPFLYLATGTGFITTEDNPALGRLLLFAIDENRLYQ